MPSAGWNAGVVGTVAVVGSSAAGEPAAAGAAVAVPCHLHSRSQAAVPSGDLIQGWRVLAARCWEVEHQTQLV